MSQGDPSYHSYSITVLSLRVTVDWLVQTGRSLVALVFPLAVRACCGTSQAV